MEVVGPPFTCIIGSFLSWQSFLPLMTAIERLLGQDYR
jgi:hypothetical protein